MQRLLLPALALVFGLASGCSNGADKGFYELCSDGECMGGTSCDTIAWERGRDGAMCTADCESDADCPFGGACFGLVGDPVDQKVCFARCDVDRDCAGGGGYVCADAELEGSVVAGICLPL